MKHFLKEARTHYLNVHNLRNNCSLLESIQYCIPSSMLHYIENNSVMKNATSYSLSLCISDAFLVCCWPLFLQAFTPQTVLRPSPTKPEISPEVEMGLYWRQSHLEWVLWFILHCLKMKCVSIMCFMVFSSVVCAFKEYLCFIFPRTSRKFSHYLSTKNRLCNSNFISPKDGSLSSLLVFHTLSSPACFVPVHWIFTPNIDN